MRLDPSISVLGRVSLCVLGAAVAACGGEEVVGDTCVSDADCTLENEVCHPFTRECVTSTCETNAECGGATPVCNIRQNDGAYPIDDEELHNLCICTPTSCTGDLTCSDVGGVCVVGAGCTANDECRTGEFCDVARSICVAGCDEYGVVGDDPCGSNEVCLNDGTCAEPCDGFACARSEMLCDPNTDRQTFNECVPTSEVGRTCANAQGVTRDDDAPVLVQVEDAGELGDCIGGEGGTVLRYVATVYTTDQFPTELFQEGVLLLGMNGQPRQTYSAGVGTPSHPEVQSVPGIANFYRVYFSLCSGMQMPTFAIQIADAEGDRSNPMCF